MKTISTPSQLKQYLDLCKEWILANDETQPEVTFFTSGWPQPSNKQAKQIGLGLLEEEVNSRSLSDCVFCGVLCTAENRVTAVANPFTRAQYMVCCASCVISHN